MWKPAMAGLHFDKESLNLLIRADGSADTLEYVRSSLSDAPSPSLREDLCLTLLEFGNAADLARVVKLGQSIREEKILPEVVSAVRARNLRPATNLEVLLQPLLESSNPIIRGNALKLAALWKLSSLAEPALRSAKDERGDPALRRLAVQALNLHGGYTETLLELGKGSDQTVRAPAIAAIASADLSGASKLAAEALGEPGTESFYSEILSGFLQRQKGADSLSEALRGRTVTKTAAAEGLKLMAASGRANKSLTEVFNRALGMSGGPALRFSDTENLVMEVRNRGDSKRGASIFRRPELGCSACHTVNGQGGTIGPNLSALGTAQPVDFIIGAILDPQKEIKEGFMSVSVLMNDGEEFQGYVRRESKDDLVLRDALQNKDVNLRRDRIKVQKLNGSVMPSGLAENLTRGEFCDLVKFLSELGKP
jgi:putative heme-binding domain-containing protein